MRQGLDGNQNLDEATRLRLEVRGVGIGLKNAPEGAGVRV
jgi:hypothetical protein